MSMALFDTYVSLVILYTLAAPALPWLFARSGGASDIWRANGLTVILLILVNALLLPACGAAGCGQGSIAILALWILAVFSLIVTLAVSSELARRRR
jgi:hypothetical protein